MAMSLAILVKGLSKQYRRLAKQSALRRLFRPQYNTVLAVHDVSFSITSGELIALIGPNGAGKSTVIKMLCGILQPTTGSVSVLGLNPLRHRKRLSHEIGAVFGQRSNLWRELPLIDSLEFAAEMYGIRQGEAQQRIQEVIRIFGLGEFVEEQVRTLSLGQRMRGELAFSFIHNPALVFMDEPTIGLDVDGKRDLRQLVREVNEHYGTTFLITSHDSGDIAFTKRTIVIRKGAVVWDGPTQRLRQQFEGRKYVRVTPQEPLPTIMGIPATMDPVDVSGVYVFDTRTVSQGDFLRTLIERGIEIRTVETVSWDDVISAMYLGGEAG